MRKMTNTLVAYTKNIHDLVIPNITKNMSRIDIVNAENQIDVIQDIYNENMLNNISFFLN